MKRKWSKTAHHFCLTRNGRLCYDCNGYNNLLSGRQKKTHRWSDDDNLIAYHVFRFGKRDLPSEIHEMGHILGMGYNSLMLKVSNFKAISGKGKLEGYSQQAVRVDKKYSGLSEGEARLAGLEAMGRALNAFTNRKE